jgi:23S rRNA (uridine2552-2'-O)-methyltransferase
MKTYRDHYFLKARQERYPARSVYKLKEIDKKFQIFAPGMAVLDLGAAPGSWSLFAAERVGSTGRVLACDIEKTDAVFPPTVTFLQEDVFARSESFNALLAEPGPFNAVISDMAPRTTGTRFTDQARSLELCEAALALALTVLIRGGSFVVKIFMGPDIQGLVHDMRGRFGSVGAFKPKSSRPESREIFYVARDFKADFP